MMKVIYKAFDSIKLSNDAKGKALDTAKNRIYKRNNFFVKRLVLGTLSVIAVSTFIFFIADIHPTKGVPVGDNQIINTLNVTEGVNDSFVYGGEIYSLNSSYNSDDYTEKEFVGKLHQVTSDSRLVNDLDSFYHDGYDVYTSDVKNILIVSFNGELLIYER